MAKRAKGKSQAAASKRNGDLLSSFLASMDRFAETISAQALAAAGDGEDRLVIQSTGESFAIQSRKLTDYFREAATRIAPVQRRDLDQFLRVQDGEALVERALRVTEQTLSGGGGAVTQGFLSWLNEIMHTLKKIAEEIGDIFGGLPHWLEVIFLIIDELLNLLKTLIGGRFGLKMSEVADHASREEVNFLRELTALAELRAARRLGRKGEDEA